MSVIRQARESAARRVEATKRDRSRAAVVAHDAASDGRFFHSVRTTGVYCGPSCPARPENVEFHRTRAAAERAGSRPCRRCKPDAHKAPE